MLESGQREYVRDLAKQIADIAVAPENERIKQRWRDVNALRKPDRPPVWCRPVGAWPELLPEESLECEDPYLRGIERGFRQTLIKRDIADDSPVEPWFGVRAAFDYDPPNVWGVDASKKRPNSAGGAWAYDPHLRTPADFDNLRLPTLSYNKTRTEERLSQAHELLGDILPVKPTCGAPLSATLGTAAADLRGLSQMMVDMMSEPELMHRLMAHLRDGVMQAMDHVEKTGLLTPNNTGPMTCSDPVGQETDGNYTFKNLWVSLNSQEFDAVSPEMWEEFCLAYQMPIVERFGLCQYGCCEDLTHKMDGVMRIPNLRVFVSSAWTDLDRVIDSVGDRHVIMWRQRATDVIYAQDTDVLKRDLQNGVKKLTGCRYQIVLREIQTLAGNLDRLHEWTRLAIEAAGHAD